MHGWFKRLSPHQLCKNEIQESVKTSSLRPRALLGGIISFTEHCTSCPVRGLAGSAASFFAGDPSSIPGLRRSPGEGIGYPLQYSWASLVALKVKNPPAMLETWVWTLGWEDPLEEGMATHSSILAWRIRMDRGAWWATVRGMAKRQTWLSDLACLWVDLEKPHKPWFVLVLCLHWCVVRESRGG